MAETTAKTTTRPRSRTRATAAKAAPAKANVPAEETTGTVTDGELTKVTFELEKLEPTKSFAKFAPPKSSGCVGTIYAPLGTETVKILLVGPAE